MKTIKLERELIISDHYDVIVAGGGVAASLAIDEGKHSMRSMLPSSNRS